MAENSDTDPAARRYAILKGRINEKQIIEIKWNYPGTICSAPTESNRICWIYLRTSRNEISYEKGQHKMMERYKIMNALDQWSTSSI